MANTVTVEIQNEKGIWREWENIALPVKYGMLLDEQLDYATISLVRIKKKEFKPLTRARLTITSTTAYTEPQSSVIEYFIANDDFYEAPVGSGAYNHELTLIELTKFLECFPLETLCFTNPNGNNYLKHAAWIKIAATERLNNFPETYYKTPSEIGTKYNLFDFNKDLVVQGGNYVGFTYLASITVENKEGTTTYEVDIQGEIVGNKEFTIVEGENKITYTSDVRVTSQAGTHLQGEQTSTFTIYGISNRYPLKPWTVNDVIQRILQVVEPIRRNQNQRFTFTLPEGAKAKLFSQFAPEFTLTRQTLREALQTVGGFIHAEPRLNVDNENNFYITFDYYGEQEYAEYKNYKTGNVKRLSDYKYRTLQSKYGIDQASTKLDSYQDNLVNRVAWEEATVGQPYQGGQQTLRTETAYIRGEEQDSFFFPTTHNIDRIVKFEYNLNGTYYDLTPYIFEKTVYDYLSSYDEIYPSSKAYALYYKNGEKGIKGFFYKAPSVLGGGVGKQYSIVNIIEREAKIVLEQGFYNYAIFRLTYVPIYNTRVQQSKTYIKDYLPLPRILNYTQSDNSVETRFFGENIKGAISRMGNVEKTYTINLRNLDNIPKAGQLWDDDYYIASVSVSVNADLFEVSVGLSKNFNRKSQYIGASSYKRIYEVSETMVQERHTVYTDYILIGESLNNEDRIDNKGLLMLTSGLGVAASIFNDPVDDIKENIVAVKSYGAGIDVSKTLQEKVMLPVIASAFGNAMEFTWEYKDNFSAGVQSVLIKEGENDDNVKGTFGQEVPYGDYYGRLYYYYFELLSEDYAVKYADMVVKDGVKLQDDLPELKKDITSNSLSLIGIYDNYPLIERKDSREKLKKSYVVEFVADDNKFVIGSALASLNPLVSYKKDRKRPHLYILPYRVNKFATHIDFSSYDVIRAEEYNGEENVIVDMGTNTATISVMPLTSFNKYILSSKTAVKGGLSWAYAIPEYDEDGGLVEDEDGNVSTLTLKKGGDLLLAKNESFNDGKEIGDFEMGSIHDVYSYLKIIK